MGEGFKQEIIKLRKQGLTYDEISNEVGCSKGTISYHCRKNGLDSYNKFIIPTKEEIEKMQSVYDKTKSSIKVAKKTGWSKATVLKYIETDNRVVLTDEERKKSGSESVVNWRRRTKLKLVKYKGGKCKCCKYNKCVEALEFHHLDPKEKDFSISGKSWSFEKLKQEVDKCILVCNRCHKEIHFGWIGIDNL